MNAITLTDGARQIVFPAVTDHGWYFFNLRGWHGQTSDKVRKEERPQAHGAFASARSLRSSRGISFEVGYRDGTTTEVEEAVNELSSFGAEGPIVITVEDDLSVTRRTVTVDSIPDNDPDRRYTGDMMVGLVAADSRRYAVVPQTASTGPAQPGPGLVFPEVWPLVWPGGGSSGRITLTNTGKAPSAPTFTLQGGFDTAMITCIETGARLGLNRQVPVGSTVLIDTENRTAVIDGQSSVSRWIQFREWEMIPAGASRTYQLDATGVIVTPGYREEIGRNWNPNPRLMNSITGWTTTGAAATLVPTVNGAQVDVTTSTSAPIFFQTFDLPAVTDDRWSGSMELTVPLGFPAAAVQLRTYAYGMNSVIGSSAPTLIQPGTTITIAADNTTALTAAATGVRTILYGNGIVSGARVFARTAIASKTATAVPYFDGSFPPSGDRSFAWAGTPDASASIAYRDIPDSPTASLEGQVFDAWW